MEMGYFIHLHYSDISCKQFGDIRPKPECNKRKTGENKRGFAGAGFQANTGLHSNDGKASGGNTCQ